MYPYVCIHSTVLLLIACIIGLCFVVCEFALQIVEWNKLNLNLHACRYGVVYYVVWFSLSI